MPFNTFSTVICPTLRTVRRAEEGLAPGLKGAQKQIILGGSGTKLPLLTSSCTILVALHRKVLCKAFKYLLKCQKSFILYHDTDLALKPSLPGVPVNVTIFMDQMLWVNVLTQACCTVYCSVKRLSTAGV